MLKILVILENSTNGFTQCTTSHPREGFYFFDDLVCNVYHNSYRYAAQMGQMSKNRQKWESKNWEIGCFNLCLQQFDES